MVETQKAIVWWKHRVSGSLIAVFCVYIYMCVCVSAYSSVPFPCLSWITIGNIGHTVAWYAWHNQQANLGDLMDPARLPLTFASSSPPAIKKVLAHHQDLVSWDAGCVLNMLGTLSGFRWQCWLSNTILYIYAYLDEYLPKWIRQF